MPESSIDPITRKRIASFRRRKKTFAVFRAILVTAAVLIGAFALISIIDWLTVLPDAARWVLTIVGYGGAALAAWFFGIRECLHRNDDAETARSMESAAPELREELLSAVELSEFDPETVHDSVEFRHLLQESVAERVADVRARKLLPWARLKKFCSCRSRRVGSGRDFGALPRGRFRFQIDDASRCSGR